MLAAKDFGHAKIRNLQEALVRHEQILEFDITMCDTVCMQIIDPFEQLLEQAQPIFQLQVPLLNQGKEFAVGAILHDHVPPRVVGAQSEALHNIGVVQALGNGVFRLDLFVILVRRLVRAALAKLLDGKNLLAVALALVRHELDRRRRALANLGLAPGKVARTRKLLVQLDRVDDEVIGQVDAHATRLETGAGFGRAREEIALQLDGHAAKGLRRVIGMAWLARVAKCEVVEARRALAIVRGWRFGGCGKHDFTFIAQIEARRSSIARRKRLGVVPACIGIAGHGTCGRAR